MLGGVLLTAVSSTNAAQKEEMDKAIDNLMAENLIKTLQIIVVGFENKVVNTEKLTTAVLPIVLYNIAETPELSRLWVKMERMVLKQQELMEKIGLTKLWRKAAKLETWPPWPWPFPWPWPDCIPVQWAFDFVPILPIVIREYSIRPEHMREFIEMKPEKAAAIITKSLRLTAEWIADAKHTAYLERLTRNVVPILIPRLKESLGLRKRSIPMMEELGRYSKQKPVLEAIAKLKKSLMKNGLTEEEALISSWAAFARGVRVGLFIAPLLAE